MQAQNELEKLIYPTGRFAAPKAFDAELVRGYIGKMEQFPGLLEDTLAGVPVSAFGYRYRPDGWNIKQIVHHVADSHLNFHIRLRLTLTEEKPTVKPYDENLWAELPDYDHADLTSSLAILRGVHERSVALLKNMGETDFARTFFHPEHKKEFDLLWLLALYAWHGAHHAGQIRVALEHKF